MLNEIKTEEGTFLFVEVPDGCEPVQIAHNIINKPNSLILYCSVQLISTTKDITEEQMESIVGKVFCKCRYGSFMTFSHPCKKECQYPISAIESFQALLCANKLELNKNYLILKKI